jgi:hypothetical protein
LRIADCGLRIVLLTAEAQRTQRFVSDRGLGIEDWFSGDDYCADIGGEVLQGVEGLVDGVSIEGDGTRDDLRRVEGTPAR